MCRGSDRPEPLRPLCRRPHVPRQGPEPVVEVASVCSAFAESGRTRATLRTASNRALDCVRELDVPKVDHAAAKSPSRDVARRYAWLGLLVALHLNVHVAEIVPGVRVADPFRPSGA